MSFERFYDCVKARDFPIEYQQVLVDRYVEDPNLLRGDLLKAITLKTDD
jgi:hypothetical protein